MLSLYFSIGSCQPGHYIFIVLVFVLVVFDPSSADLYLSFPIDIVLVFVIVRFVVVLCMFSLWIRSFLSVPVRYLHGHDRYWSRSRPRSLSLSMVNLWFLIRFVFLFLCPFTVRVFVMFPMLVMVPYPFRRRPFVVC